MKKLLSVRLKSRKTHLNGAGVVVGAVLAIATLNVLPASAQLSEGTLSNYTLVGLGSGLGTTTTFGWNSGPNPAMHFLADYKTPQHERRQQRRPQQRGRPVPTTPPLYAIPRRAAANVESPTHDAGVRPNTVLIGDRHRAVRGSTLSNNAAALTATQTYSSIANNQVITDVAGLNVIDIGSGGIHNANFTISGPSDATFVFNVTGGIQTNQVETLSGGVTASDILFNLLGTSGNIFQTSGGDQLEGTFLATNGGNFQFSELDLIGQLINVDGNVQLVSGSIIPTFAPFTPPAIPEPSTYGRCWFSASPALATWAIAAARRSRSPERNRPKKPSRPFAGGSFCPGNPQMPDMCPKHLGECHPPTECRVELKVTTSR